jgi:hypothetical protein
LKKGQKRGGMDDEEKDISSYWMTLTKREGTVNGKRRHQLALCGEFALEEAMDLSLDRLRNPIHTRSTKRFLPFIFSYRNVSRKSDVCRAYLVSSPRRLT